MNISSANTTNAEPQLLPTAFIRRVSLVTWRSSFRHCRGGNKMSPQAFDTAWLLWQIRPVNLIAVRWGLTGKNTADRGRCSREPRAELAVWAVQVLPKCLRGFFRWAKVRVGRALREFQLWPATIRSAAGSVVLRWTRPVYRYQIEFW